MTAPARNVAAAGGFRHEALFYCDDAEFAAGTADFVQRGLDDGEAVLVALPPSGRRTLEDALGSATTAVRFVDMYALGANPARIIPAWQAFVREQVEAGRGFRGIGEPLWVGRRADEVDECHLHERLLNVAFDDGPAWSLLCPYDVSGLPRPAIEGAMRSHPLCSSSDGFECSEEFAGSEGATEAFSEHLPEPPADALCRVFGPLQLVDVREQVRAVAVRAGLMARKVDDLVLAAGELATNSVRYGGGSGLFRHWRDADTLEIEFLDGGLVTDPLAGRRLPSLSREGGRGLFLVNQLCDFVQVRSSIAGTQVRVTTRLTDE
jgi:anti-sigma regulatory factor (Ser/Thr protein kinase)